MKEEEEVVDKFTRNESIFMYLYLHNSPNGMLLSFFF